MRLNVGCGKDYLPGYVNADPQEPEIADVNWPADALDVPDGSVEEVVSYQLLEHLGMRGAQRTLAHWARKLRPGGRLVIETPDLKRSAAAVAGSCSEGDADWLFGVLDPGQTHLRPFFRKELKAMLEAAGFRGIAFTEPRGVWKINAVRAEARMGRDATAARVVEAWTSLPLDQGTFRYLPMALAKGPASPKALGSLCLLSPALALVLASEHLVGGAQKKELARLDALDGLVGRMFAVLCGHPMHPREQTTAVRAARSAGLAAFRKGSLAGLPLPDRALPPSGPALFCEHAIDRLSVHHCAMGIKHFGNPERAIPHFEASLSYNRMNATAWWNLGRLRWAGGDAASGREALGHARSILGFRSIGKEMERSIPFKRPVEVSHGAV